jgi:hypothetical protein
MNTPATPFAAPRTGISGAIERMIGCRRTSRRIWVPRSS